mmetsp:Transcript_4123/g.6543  ORF Transcript_4123/g.6543 Transcript_4123/m.6543 type:complete len:388 (-) Transcript_4123:1700-2863(-)
MRQEFINGAVSAKDDGIKMLAENVNFEYYFQKKVSDIARLVAEREPTIVHIACHGSTKGEISIGGEVAAPDSLSDALAVAVKGQQGQQKLRLVILNACSSALQAKMLAPLVDFVMAHQKPVEDEVAVEMSKVIYFWMGRNQSLIDASKLARQKCESLHLLARIPANVHAFRREAAQSTVPQTSEENITSASQHEPLSRPQNWIWGTQYTALIHAAKTGDLSLVEERLHHDDINAHDIKSGFTALIAAVYYNNPAIAERLLRANAMPNPKAKSGFSALHVAALKGQTGTVSLLLQANADSNAQGAGMLKLATPTYLAAQEGAAEIVDLLLNANGSPHLHTTEGTIPLQAAAQFGETRVISRLLKAGSHVNHRDNVPSTCQFPTLTRGS